MRGECERKGWGKENEDHGIIMDHTRSAYSINLKELRSWPKEPKLLSSRAALHYGGEEHRSYQGHTKNPKSGASQKYQPYVFSKNTRLGFMLAGDVGVARRRAEPCNHQL